MCTTKNQKDDWANLMWKQVILQEGGIMQAKGMKEQPLRPRVERKQGGGGRDVNGWKMVQGGEGMIIATSSWCPGVR